MIKNILFDFDGTIANTAPGIVATMAETFRQMNIPVPSDDAMRQTIGIPLLKALQNLASLSDEEAAEAVVIYSALFREIELNYTSIYPHVEETLAAMKDRGMRLAIVTSRNRESLEQILSRYGLGRYFETLMTNDERLADREPLRPKPAPDMALAMLRQMAIRASETLVVGDTTFDIEMGNSAQCTTCAVTYGNHMRQQLLAASPTFIIDDFAGLLDNVITSPANHDVFQQR